jgi:hypothetical protein
MLGFIWDLGLSFDGLKRGCLAAVAIFSGGLSEYLLRHQEMRFYSADSIFTAEKASAAMPLVP